VLQALTVAVVVVIISDNPNDTLYPITDLDLREMQDYEFEIYGRYLWDCSIKL